MKLLGNAISMVGLYVIYFGSFGQERGFEFSWAWLLLTAVIGGALTLLGQTIVRLIQDKHQKVRNDAAKAIFRSINEDKK